jgi:hypothetical protein
MARFFAGTEPLVDLLVDDPLPRVSSEDLLRVIRPDQPCGSASADL